MKTRSIFIIIIWGLISFSCCGSRQTVNTNTNTNTDISTETPNREIIETPTDEIDDWSSQPDSNSSRIKVLNAASMFSSLPNGLGRMGYGIVENSGNSITTTIANDIRVIAWVEGQDVILAADVQQYTESEFGLREPSELVSCVKGTSTSMPDCWRTILVIANKIGGTKQYQ